MNEANRRAIEKTPYKINDNSQHIMMFILPKEEVDISYLKTLISDYHRESYSTVTFEINAMMMGLDMHLLTVKFFDDKNNSVAESFGLPGFPFWVFINEDGTVNLRHTGSLRSEAFERIITSGIQ